MSRKEEIMWGAGLITLGIFAYLIFKRQITKVVQSGESGYDPPPLTFPKINIGDFVVPQMSRDLFRGYFPCKCGCDGSDVNGGSIGNIPEALKNVLLGNASVDAIGDDPTPPGRAFYFSELPSGRRPGSLH